LTALTSLNFGLLPAAEFLHRIVNVAPALDSLAISFLFNEDLERLSACFSKRLRHLHLMSLGSYCEPEYLEFLETFTALESFTVVELVEVYRQLIMSKLPSTVSRLGFSPAPSDPQQSSSFEVELIEYLSTRPQICTLLLISHDCYPTRKLLEKNQPKLLRFCTDTSIRLQFGLWREIWADIPAIL